MPRWRLPEFPVPQSKQNLVFTTVNFTCKMPVISFFFTFPFILFMYLFTYFLSHYLSECCHLLAQTLVETTWTGPLFLQFRAVLNLGFAWKHQPKENVCGWWHWRVGPTVLEWFSRPGGMGDQCVWHFFLGCPTRPVSLSQLIAYQFRTHHVRSCFCDSVAPCSSTQVIAFYIFWVETYVPIKAHPGGMESVQAPLTAVIGWIIKEAVSKGDERLKPTQHSTLT